LMLIRSSEELIGKAVNRPRLRPAGASKRDWTQFLTSRLLPGSLVLVIKTSEPVSNVEP
jgi:hypothetical protein